LTENQTKTNTMKITTELTDYSEIYDAIQVGDIKAKIGDVINEKYIMVNSYHLEPIPDGKLFLYEEACKNNSTGYSWTESFIGIDPLPNKRSGFDHIETISITKTPFTL